MRRSRRRRRRTGCGMKTRHRAHAGEFGSSGHSHGLKGIQATGAGPLLPGNTRKPASESTDISRLSEATGSDSRASLAAQHDRPLYPKVAQN